MSAIRDLLEGAAILSVIGGGTGLLVLFGRDRTAANEHDLWAYHDEPTAELEPRRHLPTPRQPWTERNVDERVVVWHHLDVSDMDVEVPARLANPALGRRIRPAAALTKPVGLAAWEPEPAPSVFDGPVPPLARALMIEHAVPTLSDAAIRATADDWLWEIAAEQRARAGIVRVVSPATDRDLTGAFAVVAVA